MKKYDAIIIGFGKAGKTLAAELGTRGWNVAIICLLYTSPSPRDCS